jgi:lysozyme
MDQSFKAQLKQLIVSHEGFKTHPYTDTKGNVTIGVGYNLTARGLPESFLNEKYDEDAEFYYTSLLKDFDWYESLCDARKMVLIDMCFMGYKTFKEFERMLQALRYGDYEKAAQEILNSLWAQQVGHRAIQNAEIMRTGVICSQQA